MTRIRKAAAATTLCTLLAAALCAATPAMAASAASTPAGGAPAANLALAQARDAIPISVDGRPLQTRGRLVDGRTMVPLKGFGGEMGMSVDIRADADTADSGKAVITDGARTIFFDVGQGTATVGDHRTQVLPGALSLDGQTYAPLRFMAENMGFRVVWDAAVRSVALFRVEDNPVKIETVRDISETETLQVNIQYPRISGLENEDAEGAFNEYIRKVAAA